MLKGRKFLSILILGITSLLLLLSVSIPISFNSKAQIPFTLGKTMEQLTFAQQLGKWFLPFASMDTSKYSISNETPAILSTGNYELKVKSAKPGTVIINFSQGNIDRDYRFLVSRNPKLGNGCIVSLTIDNTLWKRMIDPDSIDEKVMRSLKNLEKFTNNTALFYGLPIHKSAITDHSYLYISKVVNPEQKATGTKILFDSLFSYARRLKISSTGKRIYSSQLIDSNELRIFAGIAINGEGKPNPATGITIKKMQVEKNLLVADFNGSYKDIIKAYKALDQFKRDYQLVSMETPYEEFLTPGNSYQPDDTVSIRVCQPIF